MLDYYSMDNWKVSLCMLLQQYKSNYTRGFKSGIFWGLRNNVLLLVNLMNKSTRITFGSKLFFLYHWYWDSLHEKLNSH